MIKLSADRVEYQVDQEEPSYAGRLLVLTEGDFNPELSTDTLCGISVDTVLIPKQLKGTDKYKLVKEDIEGIIARSRNPEIKFY